MLARLPAHSPKEPEFRDDRVRLCVEGRGPKGRGGRLELAGAQGNLRRSGEDARSLKDERANPLSLSLC